MKFVRFRLRPRAPPPVHGYGTGHARSRAEWSGVERGARSVGQTLARVTGTHPNAGQFYSKKSDQLLLMITQQPVDLERSTKRHSTEDDEYSQQQYMVNFHYVYLRCNQNVIMTLNFPKTPRHGVAFWKDARSGKVNMLSLVHIAHVVVQEKLVLCSGVHILDQR